MVLRRWVATTEPDKVPVEKSPNVRLDLLCTH